jgi:cytochrome P450
MVVEDVYLPPQYGPIEFLRRIRSDQLSVFSPEIFKRHLVYSKLLFLNSFLVIKPDYIEQVLLTNQQNYVKSQFVQRLLGPALGEGLFTAEGELWRRHRRIASPAFQHRRVEGFVDIMAECSAAMADRWARQSASLDIAAEMMGLTLEIIARTLFSTDVTHQIERVRQLMEVLIYDLRPSALDLFGFPQWLPRPMPRSVKKAIAEFDAMMSEIIAPRRADGVDRGDLLSMLMAARDPETDEAMSDRQLRDEIMTFFLAGHETTANALGFAWWLLAQNPQAKSKLQAEADRLPKDRPLGFGDLAAVPYAKMVFEEALRLYPPAHTISRRSVAEDVIGGVRVPANSLVTISTYVTHRSPALWPDPERFDPERFTAERSAGRHRFAYLPFGGGPRICIGMPFAIAEAQIILATLARSCTIELVPNRPVEPIGMITLRAKGGIWARVAKRG